MVTIIIGPNEANVRLDRLLRKRLPLTSLSEIYRIIRTGRAKVDGRKAKGEARLTEGQSVTVIVNEAESAAVQDTPDAIRNLIHTDYFKRNFNILYEDEVLMVCNKPTHLVVHPGTSHLHHNTLIELAQSYMLNKPHPVAGDEAVLVHRLDRDTSGIILIAKNLRTVRYLNEQLRDNRMNKKYLAICHGIPARHAGSIVLGLEKTHERNSGTKMRVDDDGQASKSTYHLLAMGNNISKLQVRLHTGRTHQIRVHLNHIGCPIIGDVRYGNEIQDNDFFRTRKAMRRLYLHAHELTFAHPLTLRAMTMVAPEPEEFARLLQIN